MKRMSAAVIGVLLVMGAATGCGDPHQRLNAPPQGESTGPRPEWGNYYTYHNDQGMLADMSIADIHFVPHTAKLSGTGVARLERYAELLEGQGGTLCYETQMTPDTDLVEARLATAREFLSQAGCGAETIQVVMGGAGGRGMTGKEALAGQEVAKQPEPRKTAYRLKKYMAESK